MSRYIPYSQRIRCALHPILSSTPASADTLSWGRALTATLCKVYHNSVSIAGVTFFVGDFCRSYVGVVVDPIHSSIDGSVYRIESIDRTRVCTRGIATSETSLTLRMVMTPKQLAKAGRNRDRRLVETFEENELIWTDHVVTFTLRPNAFELCKVFSRDRYLAYRCSQSLTDLSRTFFVTRSKESNNSLTRCTPITDQIKAQLSITPLEEDQRRPIEARYTEEPERLFEAVPLQDSDRDMRQPTNRSLIFPETMTYGGHKYKKDAFALFDTFDGERVAEIMGFDLSSGGQVTIHVRWLCSPSHPALNGAYDSVLPIHASGLVRSLFSTKYDCLDMIRSRMMPNRPCEVIGHAEWNRRKARGENMKDVFFQIREQRYNPTYTSHANDAHNSVGGSAANSATLVRGDCTVPDGRYHSCASVTLADGRIIRVGEFYRSTRKDYDGRHDTTIVLVHDIRSCGDTWSILFRNLLSPSAAASDSVNSFHPDELLWSRQTATAHVFRGVLGSSRELESCRVMSRENYLNAIEMDHHMTPIYFVTRAWSQTKRRCTEIDEEMKKVLSQPSQPLASSPSHSTRTSLVHAAAAAASSSSVGALLMPSHLHPKGGDSVAAAVASMRSAPAAALPSTPLFGDSSSIPIRAKVEPAHHPVYPVPPLDIDPTARSGNDNGSAGRDRGDALIDASSNNNNGHTGRHTDDSPIDDTGIGHSDAIHSSYQQLQLDFDHLRSQHAELQVKHRQLADQHSRVVQQADIAVDRERDALRDVVARLRADVNSASIRMRDEWNRSEQLLIERIVKLEEVIDHRGTGRPDENTTNSSSAAESSPSADRHPPYVDMAAAAQPRSQSSSGSLKRKAESDLPDQRHRGAPTAATHVIIIE